MRRTEVLQQVPKKRFEEAYRGWQKGFFKMDANLLKSVGREQEPDVRNHARLEGSVQVSRLNAGIPLNSSVNPIHTKTHQSQ